MKTIIDRNRSALWSITVACGGAILLTAGLVGMLELGLAGNSAWNAAPLAALMAATAGAGFTWQRRRAKARRREAALDAYAEREIARGVARARRRRDPRGRAPLQLNGGAPALHGASSHGSAQTRRSANLSRAAVLHRTARQEEKSHATSI